jgi:hypothetical protein
LDARKTTVGIIYEKNIASGLCCSCINVTLAIEKRRNSTCSHKLSCASDASQGSGIENEGSVDYAAWVNDKGECTQ